MVRVDLLSVMAFILQTSQVDEEDRGALIVDAELALPAGITQENLAQALNGQFPLRCSPASRRLE